MRRTAVVALATTALLAVTGLSAGEALAETTTSHVVSARSASLVAGQARDAVRVVKKRKQLASTTFSNAPHRKPAAKKPAAKQPAATRPADTTPDGTTTAPTSRAVALARGNRASRDMVGWLPSLYQGTWFRPEVESIRQCIMDRESNFNYAAVGAGTYFGAYQLNRGLAVTATRTMEPEVRQEMGAEGVKVLRALRRVAPNHWNRYWQDRAFYTVWHNGAGKGHWQGGGLNCF
jgi:hypothetical protein